MATDLIVDFPCNPRKSRTVRFAEMSQLHIFKLQDVARHELWYTKEEYRLMELVRLQDVLKVRAAAARKPREPADVHDDMSTKESVCVMGIEHLLTPACINEVRACRARCTRAVLMEQARQGPSPDPDLGWEAISLASLVQTREATLRAMRLGELHQESI